CVVEGMGGGGRPDGGCGWWRYHEQLPSRRSLVLSSGFFRGAAAGGVSRRKGRTEDQVELGIAGLRVLVTAGGDGIGREIARAFVAEGANVHVCDIDEKALAQLKQNDPKITQSRADVADRSDVARLFEEAVGVLGGLDVLVNNAGIAGPTGRVEEIAPAEWDRCLAVNI